MTLSLIGFVGACASQVGRLPAAAPEAQAYLDDWKRSGGGTYVGIGIRGNGEEDVFRNNAKRSESDWYRDTATAGDMLETFEQYTKAKGCISKVMMAGHGWGDARRAGGPGFPLASPGAGFYLDRDTVISNRVSVGPAARYMKHLEEKINGSRGFAGLGRRGPSIKFCDRCLIEVHACNVSPKFTATLASVTGCMTVAGTGQVAPRYANDNTGRTDHIWSSSPESSGSDCKTMRGDACNADFFRYTPVRGVSGATERVVEERLGRYYTAQ